MAYNQRYLFTSIDRKEQWAYILSIEANEISQTNEDKNVNRSRVNIVGKLKSQYYNYSAGRDQKLQIWWQDDYGNLKEVMLAETKFKTIGYKGEIVVSGVANVNHKPNGTLNGRAVAKFIKDTTSKYAPESGNVDINFALTTIPRATILSNKTLTIGQNSTISWTKASDSFTHKLEYKFGRYSGVIGTGLVDSVDWTPSNELYSVIPNSPSGKGTLTLTTYNGNTITGTSSATLTLNANESNSKAQITYGNVADVNNKTINLTGNNNKLVLNASTSYAVIEFTTRQYAKAKAIYINGGSYSIPKGETSGANTNYHFEANLGISKTGTYDIIIVDTRDYKTTYRVSKTTINYITLDSNIKIKRIAPTTGEVGLTFDGNYFNGGFGKSNNYLKISYAYRIKSYGNYSAFKPITQFKIVGNTFHSGTANYKQTIKLAESFDYRNTYDIQIKFEDAITTKITNAIIVKGIPIFRWNSKKFVVNGDLKIANENGENEKDIVDMMYPVGSLYLSTNEINPKTLFGKGEWQRLSGGYLYATDSSYSQSQLRGRNTQNSAETTTGSHILTTEEMPKHSHKFERQQWYSADVVSNQNEGTIFSWKGGAGVGGTTSKAYWGNVVEEGKNQGHTHTIPSHSHEIANINIVVWRRIS